MRSGPGRVRAQASDEADGRVMIDRKLYHEKVAEQIRREVVANRKPGDQLASDTVQAARFGVSVNTIRAAMQLLCNEGLLVREHGRGTFVADLSAARRVLVLILPEVLDTPSSFFFGKVFRGVEEALRGEGLEPVLCLREDQDAAVRELVRQAPPGTVRGAIVVQHRQGARFIEELEGQGIPVVSHGELRADWVVYNDHAGLVGAGVDYLVARGRRRITFLQPRVSLAGGPEWFLTAPFREAMGRAGAEVRADWLCAVEDPKRPGSGWDHFSAIWHSRGEKPDGLLIGMDTLYRDAAMAILHLGIRVPDDLVVVTHANRGSGLFYPFPTVRLEFDPARYAREMVAMLSRRIGGGPAGPARVCLPWTWAGREEVEQRAPRKTAAAR